jgi:hypothetical protein
MTVERREIFAPSAVETPSGDLGAEGQHGNQPSSHGALGSETAHGDVQAYRETRIAVSHGLHDQGATGLALPTGIDGFTTEGR